VFDSVLDTEVLESILVVEGLRLTSADDEWVPCLGGECSASKGGGGGGNSSSSQGLYSRGGSGRESVLVSLPCLFSCSDRTVVGLGAGLGATGGSG